MSSRRSLAALLVLASILALTAPATPFAAEPDPVLPGTEAAGEACGAEIHLESRMQRDPEAAARRELMEALVRSAQAKGLVPAPGTQTNGSIVYTIPVAVHIVHGGGPENISYAQVLSQIAAINRDCQNLPSNGFPAADCQIQFCLATQLPSGSSVQWANVSEPGVTRHQSSVLTVAQINNDAALKAVNYLPSDKYLNVWVVQKIQINGANSGIVGYATFPGSVPATQDGIVMDYRVMGANNTGYGTFPTLLPTYEEGKVFAHEVGHWLDLFHTFHGGCSVGDQVADTPPQDVNAWNCPGTIPSTCTANGGDPIHNFMDYTNDACRWQFTAGQKARMHAAISTYRATLVSPANLVATLGGGACAPALFAVVNLDASQACTGAPIACSGPACGGCTYSWSFPGGTGSTSGQNTSVTFANPGVYTVTLTMSDGTNTSTASAKVYVHACAPITGACTNWVFGNMNRLTFASGMPVSVGGTQNAGPEASSQISDASGNLLFYTDNRTIWNANHAPMNNSAGFFTAGGGRSSHNGALIVPRPSTPNQYFLFSVNEWEKYPNASPLSITTIDMLLDGGLGAVTSTCVPIPLPVGATQSPRGLLEGMTLIPHCNATDWWLVTAGADKTNASFDWQRFVYVTPITSAGAGATTQYPVGFNGAGGGASAWGAIVASKDGARLGICQADTKSIRIYDFDRSSGVPTLALDTGDIGANQDFAFSPDGKLIYYTYLLGSYDTFGNGKYGLRQMDLATQQVRVLRPPTTFPTGTQDVQLGPDDRIYAARAGMSALDCINFPNAFNVLDQNECGFNLAGIPLGSPINVIGALPNTLTPCSVGAAPASFTYTVTNCTTVQFKSPNCGPWNWSFGDGGNSNAQSPSHVFAPGTYTVTLTAPSASPPTFQAVITIGNQPISIAGPSTACGGPLNYTAVGPSNYVYTWTITGGSPGTWTGSNVFVSWGLNSGTVQLTATDPATGCVSNAFAGVEACSECHRPPLDMVAWWPLDESPGGTLAQEIVAANNGQDATAVSPAKVPGAVGMGRLFDGSTGVIRVNDHSKLDLGTGNLTIDAWIRTSSLAPLQGIVEKRLLSPDRGYALYLKQGRPALLLGDGSTIVESWASGTASLADGAWHHVAATVDRANSAAGTRLFVDGTLVASFPAYPASASLANTERLVIGAQQPATTPTGWFDGSIDEVEIFTKALGDARIAKLWGAGPAGKCKQFVQALAQQTLCTAQAFTTAKLYVCNQGSTPQQFNLSYPPNSGGGCTGPPLTSFTNQSPANPVAVPAGACLPVTVQIAKPAGLTHGLVSCYGVTATNVATGVGHTSVGQIWASDAACPIVTSSGGGLAWGDLSTSASVSWSLRNTSPVAQAIPIVVEPHPVGDEEFQPLAILSLNGLPPGTPWYSNVLVPPGDSATITIDAQFVAPRPFQSYDLALYADGDADGFFDAAASVTLLYSEVPVGVVAAGAIPAPATVVRLLPVAPNPFSGATRVEYELPRPGWLRIGLFDVAGRRVRRLADGLALAGRGSLAVDAGNLPSGVYFVRLETQGEVRTARIVLLRD